MNIPIEAAMRTLKLGGMAKDWREVKYQNNEQYLSELLDIEMRERERLTELTA